MTGEQLERAIEFLLANQAKHDAQIEELHQGMLALRENQAKNDAQIGELTAAVLLLQSETRESVSILMSSMQSLANTMQILGVSQIDLKQRVEKLESPK